MKLTHYRKPSSLTIQLNNDGVNKWNHQSPINEAFIGANDSWRI